MSGPIPVGWPGIDLWVRVTAANNGTPITDATFSCPYYYQGSNGYYNLTIAASADYWCKAPSYGTYFGNSDNSGFQAIALPWQGGGWPTTQTY